MQHITAYVFLSLLLCGMVIAMKTIKSFEIDKETFTIDKVSSSPNDKQYWHGKTPHERLEAVEIMRQLNYGYDKSTRRLQRIFEIAQRASG